MQAGKLQPEVALLNASLVRLFLIDIYEDQIQIILSTFYLCYRILCSFLLVIIMSIRQFIHSRCDIVYSYSLSSKEHAFNLMLFLSPIEQIPDIFPVLAAAHKALLAKSRESLTTRTLHSELVYSYSGSKHVLICCSSFQLDHFISVTLQSNYCEL